MKEFTVTKNDAGQRLDRFVSIWHKFWYMAHDVMKPLRKEWLCYL